MSDERHPGASSTVGAPLPRPWERVTWSKPEPPTPQRTWPPAWTRLYELRQTKRISDDELQAALAAEDPDAALMDVWRIVIEREEARRPPSGQSLGG